VAFDELLCNRESKARPFPCGSICRLNLMKLFENRGLLFNSDPNSIVRNRDRYTAVQVAAVVSLPPITMSVNVSARQFRNDNFLESVSAILDETGLSPKHLDHWCPAIFFGNLVTYCIPA
jgi:EAL domain-containing protein (putative c-di-GMP-specific phosphodiesterase class I)